MAILLDRDQQLQALMQLLGRAAEGRGHVALVSGEAGAGKTTLIEAFLARAGGTARVFRGACEDLSIPEPLGPLYDLARHAFWPIRTNDAQGARLALFSEALAVFDEPDQSTLLVIEDLHWADDATLDFVRFLGRRIASTRILLVLTGRSDGSNGQRRVRRALAEVQTDNLTRLEVPLLTEAAVQQLARDAGQDGSQIYLATAGNAFFVSELLRAGGAGAVPPGAADAVLARADKLSAGARTALDVVSIFPRRAEGTAVASMLGEIADTALSECLGAGTLREEGGYYQFRHEIARRALEAALTPHYRRSLNAAALHVLRSAANVPAARLLHHAVEANEDAAVRELAPAAAAEAARLGAHREAARLFATAVGVIPAEEPVTRASLLQQLAFESHLIGAVAEAIVAQSQARDLYSAVGNTLKEGDCLRWLSRLSYLAGDRTGADAYARQALQLLESGPAGPELAMALSNLAHLGMLADRVDETLSYGRQAIALAEKVGRADIICHSLNNVGTVQQWTDPIQGRRDLEDSLEIALAGDFQEHAARAYTNLACLEINLLAYRRAEEVLQEGIGYCIGRDLDTWRDYMRAWQSELLLRQGEWDRAADTAQLVLNNEQATPLARYPATLALARLRIRRGDTASDLLASLALYLERGMELQRLAPYATLMAERAWLGDMAPEGALHLIDQAVAMLPSSAVYGELFVWRAMLSGESTETVVLQQAYAAQLSGDWQAAAATWRRLGTPFEQGLSMLGGDEAAQTEALNLFRQLGARAVVDRVRRHLYEQGRPERRRGPYRAARDNSAGLTAREMEVLQLIATGLSNKAIANSLAISPKTVDHHVSAVLEKLGALSRSEASAVARNRGLL